MSFEFLLRFAFPPACPACDAAGDDDLLCATCLRGVATRRGAPPLAVPGLDSVVAPGRYEGVLRALIVRLKYGGDRRPLRALVATWAEVLADAALLGRPDAVVPVPTSALRRRLRGFNQAELLGAAAARALGVPMLPGALRRRRRRPAQAGLDREARVKNLVGAFASPGGVFGRAVLLVDDVVTTGATLAESARAVRAAGARRVTALAVAAID